MGSVYAAGVSPLITPDYATHGLPDLIIG